MSRRVRIYPYKITSRGAREIRDCLEEQNIDALLVYPDRDYRPQPADIIIGWGAGTCPRWEGHSGLYLNHWRVCNNAINKLRTFEMFAAAGVPCPEFTTDQGKAKNWLRYGHSPIVVRHTLEGMDGDGVELADKMETIPYAPLYTKYLRKTEEFRVHVFQGEAVYCQIKEKRTGFEGTPNPQVRTTSQGWGLSTADECPKECQEAAIAAVAAVRLDFGAVDVVWNKYYGAAALEVNSAPELNERVAQAYCSKILPLANAR